MDDQNLWRSIQGGEEQAFKVLFYQHFTEMVHWAHRFVQDEGVAKDMAQDVFFKIWDRRDTLKIKDRIKPYLMQATRNHCLNHLKKRKTGTLEDHVEPVDDAHSPQDHLEAEDMEAQIQRAVAQMPDACRAAFLLRRTEQMPIKEIAQQLQIAPKTVENQLSKARKILIRYLKPVLMLFFVFSINGEGDVGESAIVPCHIKDDTHER